ncbi:homeobox-leucine zipper protein PROTODERMAL FACTOR 2-like [Zingiber officinale]|uniref:homeobox-leucine zipper protein PROTODERMAL FACTOR 2-like n=1 Tax=Zingiber officinale TaxID=94328 RepID=UPI001C4DD18C|nr:homeobox-leucine zipper protein PROTODERMAL FACTOR 2-like [Zingiber officinale]
MRHRRATFVATLCKPTPPHASISSSPPHSVATGHTQCRPPSASHHSMPPLPTAPSFSLSLSFAFSQGDVATAGVIPTKLDERVLNEPEDQQQQQQQQFVQMDEHNQMEHEDNLRLKEENTQLLTENVKLKGALRTIRCSNCGQPPTLDEKSIDELILENAGMREKNDKFVLKRGSFVKKMDWFDSQIEMVMGLIAKYTSRPLRTPSVLLEPPVAELNLILSRKGPETEKTAAHLLAVVAMEELLAMAQREAPLWIPGIAGLGEALNEEEYARAFPGGLGPRFAGLGIEASRATAIIAMDAVRLVDILMDVSKWSAFFSSIVAGATYITGYSFGTGESYDGSLQLITAELQAPSPLVALREGLFLRHCKLHGEGLWAVVDVSFEVSPDATMTKFRRRPSGCIIQQLPDDRSKVDQNICS